MLDKLVQHLNVEFLPEREKFFVIIIIIVT